MADEQVLKRVIKVTARVLELNEENIKPTDNFIFDLGAESVQSVELVASFEEEFDIDMDEDAAMAVQTVGEAAEFIGGQLKD